MSGEGLAVVGRRVRKIDGRELVSGRARFTADMKFPGMVHGSVSRASVPAGVIRSIDTGAAARAEGVLLVLTAKDIPGPNLIGIIPPFDQPVLAMDVIRYAGESVALVVAESPQAARAGAAAVRLNVDPLVPVLTVDEALADGARKIHPRGNVTCSKKLVKGDVGRGFADAEVIVEGTFETSHQEHAYLEPEAVCAVPEGDGASPCTPPASPRTTSEATSRPTLPSPPRR